jgi:RNA polymerase sigma factor (sigma-70 family)
VYSVRFINDTIESSRPARPPRSPGPIREGRADPAGSTLDRYFTEIGGARVLTRTEEQEIARRLRARRAAIHEILAGLPCTGTLLIERWRAQQRGVLRPTGLQAHGASGNPERNARTVEATLRRVERRLRRRPPTVPRTRSDQVAWDRFESRQRRDLDTLDLSPDFYHEVEEALLSHLREIDSEPHANARHRARRLRDEVGFPVRRFRRRMRALDALRGARDEARNELARHNLKLVVTLAKGFQNLGVPFADLIQEANLGLLRAVDLFDPDRGLKFSTYAVWWIRQSLVRAVQRQSRTVRLPSHVNDRLYQVGRASERLTGRLGRRPTSGELGRETGLDTEWVDQLRSLQMTPLSIDQPADSTGTRAPHELLPDPRVVSPPDLVDAARDRRAMGGLLEQLDARERIIITRRFGFTGEERVSLQGLARELGLSRELVRRVEKRALCRLRHWVKASQSNGGPS